MIKAYFVVSSILYLVSRFSPYAWNVETDGIQINEKKLSLSYYLLLIFV